MQIAVLGAGAWGTALAMSYAAGGHAIRLWTLDEKHASDMRAQRINQHYLPGLTLSDNIQISSSLDESLQDAELILIVTPVAGLRPTLTALHQRGNKVPVLWACKGFESGSGLLPHEVVAEILGALHPCGALTGPSFAAEVARGMPCAITLASQDAAFAADWAARLHHPLLRLYANGDVIGAEVGGAVKNVLAIAAGISDGLGYGLNARAALMTRGLAEIARLAEALGGRRETLMGLAGMGDLILTCTGDLSRNRRVGLALAEGKALPEVLKELGHVAEGVLTCEFVVERANRLQVEMPITRLVHAVLSGQIPARNALEQLMARDPRHE
ncbi:NAD(P)H-dependent glycerol-3-phosphate dehydrogenase [Viridibacterium curvum]|uniref:Glycerol-3-phosphate dehydrogenase [NAD(P)+] n=1 Tax=Viridibacterium curvum TaxID=1101404 RepID=A0ABP9QCW5_9RHOO